MFPENLIVAEKDSIAKAFAKYLSGSKYRTLYIYRRVPIYVFYYAGCRWGSIGLRGHVLDFDYPERYNDWEGVDPRVLFFVRPVRVVREESSLYYRILRELARHVKRVVLALDADVEGEAIALEVKEIMSSVNPRIVFERVLFNAVTEHDIKSAMLRRGTINLRWAYKSIARSIIDLTLGAAFTRELTNAVRKIAPHLLPYGKFLSYGPCQTPVLYFVVERAIERENFKPETYYVLRVRAVADDGNIEMVSEQKFKSLEEARRAAAKVKESGALQVHRAKYVKELVKPPEPLNTIEFEKAASKFLNLRPKQALDIAERLYQEGYISYPRTETTIYPKTLNLREIVAMMTKVPELSRYASEVYAKPYLKPTAGREDDGAHPPIYPTAPATLKELVRLFGQRLGRVAWKVYEYIARHFLATVSDPALIEKQRIEARVGSLSFVAEGIAVLREGFFRVYPYARPKEVKLPRVSTGDVLEVVNVSIVKRRTEPPPYLSEAELLSLMKRFGIGTDATMQEHIHTNILRGYFIVRNKRCIPTPLGKALILALKKYVPELVMPTVRGRIERELQKIVSGELTHEQVIEKVRAEFLKYFDKLRLHREEIAKELVKALAEMVKNRKSSR